MKFAKKAVAASSGFAKKAVGGLVLAASSGVALAQTTAPAGPDLTSLTSSVSMGTVITAVLAVAAAMVGLHLTIKGAKIVLGMIRTA
jgi:hypothetical protein